MQLLQMTLWVLSALCSIHPVDIRSLSTFCRFSDLKCCWLFHFALFATAPDCGAEDGIRTRNIQLGKLTLYR